MTTRFHTKEHEQVLSHDELKRLLSYDQDTGLFTWNLYKPSNGGKVRPGVVAGTPDGKGALLIGINRMRYAVHRLAWFYVHKKWPPHEVDHVNMVQTDNRIVNLRLATKTMNRANQRVRKDSASGLKGVSYIKQRRVWRARIKNRTIGQFRTMEEAHAAYVAAAQVEFGEFARAA